MRLSASQASNNLSRKIENLGSLKNTKVERKVQFKNENIDSK